MKLADLKLNPDNPRTIKPEKLEKLAQSIKDFPKMMEKRPIVYDEDKVIIGGNMRYRAIEMLGMKEIPDEWVTDASDFTQDERYRFIMQDNAEMGEHDWDLVANQYELEDLEAWGIDVPYADSDKEVEEDEAPEVSSEPAKSKLGEIYQLGRHRVMCGDSTDADAVSELMDGNKADMVFTDPPYGVDYDGGATSKRDKLASDNKNTSIYKEALPNIYVHSKNSAALYIWHAAGYADMATELTEANYVIRNQLIWNKNQAQYGALSAQYKQKHEPCFYAHKKGQAPSWYGDTKQTTVWDISRESKNEHHPTQKPVELVGMALRNSSKAGDTVLDLFLGSGSTLIACEQTDRTCYGMELDPKYVDIIRKRYAKFTNNNELPDDWEALTPVVEKAGEKQVVENAVS